MIKIYCNKLSNSQAVNKLGKYLYDNLPDTFKYKKSGNMFDIYMNTNEDDVNINITTYQNKLRINVILMNGYDYTITSLLILAEKCNDIKYLEDTRIKIINKLLSESLI